jgi:hypothetical protein
MADITISKFTTQVVRTGSTPSSSGFAVNEGQDPVNPSGTGNFVPYSGATDNVELGEFGIEAGFVQLDTTPTNTPTTQGSIYWDEDDETIAVILNGTIMKIGEDQFYPVKNQTGSTIAKGTAVRFAGTVGASGRLLIAPFIADNSVASSRFMGVTSEAILNGADGKVMWFGRIRGINTNAFNEGDVLYASTTTAGGFQTTIPVAPNNIVQVAAVVTKSINNGTIFVRPTLGSNINKDEGVKIVSPTTGQLLQLQSNGLWENKTKAQVLAGTSSQFVKGDGSLDSTAYVSSVTASSPLASSGGATPNITIQQASGSQNGFLSSTDWTTFNNKTSNVGTVTSVAALTLGTSGTDLSSSVANGTTTPVITLNVPTASASNRGALSAADWTTFNNKTSNLGTVTSVGLSSATSGVTIGSTPVTTSGTITLAIATASGSQNGLLSSTDWTTFNGKQNALTNPVTGTGTSGQVAYFTGTSAISSESNLFWDATNDRLGIGTISPSQLLHLKTELGTSSGVGSAIQIESGGAGGDQGWIGVNKGSGNGLTFSVENRDIIFRTAASTPFGGSERMRIFSDGNVFIGSSPSNAGFKLDVNGTGRFAGVGFGSNGLQTAGANGGNGIYAVAGGSAGSGLYGFTNDLSSFGGTFEHTGAGQGIALRVIGFSTFSQAATFSSSVTALRYIANAQATYGSLTYEETFKYASSPAGIWFGNSFNSNNNVGLQLRTSNDNTSVQALTITPQGNVLIGTATNGASKLRISGLPTSAAGLSSGDVYNLSGVLMIA